MTRGFLLHLRPPRVAARALRFTHTFGLGGASLVLAALLAVTGALMTLVYQPAPAAAFEAVVAIERDIAFGPLVRGMHYWSANLLVVVMLAHTARVFLTGAYHGRRRVNWFVGLGLLAAVFVSAFTGYLLPWDQRSFWAVTISTSMLGYVPLAGDLLQRVARGGSEVGATTLVAFYTLHTTIVPAVLAGLLAYHFWRVRKAGGVVVPPPREGEEGGDARVPFVPDLFVREAALALIVAAVVVVLAAAFGAPLGDRANPGMSPNPAKAPWYFMGWQELLVHVHPVVAVVVIPVLALVALVALPYAGREDDPTGAWFLSPRGRRAAAWSGALALAVLPLGVVAHEFAAPRLPTLGGGATIIAAVLPLAVVVAMGAALARFVRSRLALRRAEVVQAVVVSYAVGFAVLTAIGTWCRGAHMALVWPWTR